VRFYFSLLFCCVAFVALALSLIDSKKEKVNLRRKIDKLKKKIKNKKRKIANLTTKLKKMKATKRFRNINRQVD